MRKIHLIEGEPSNTEPSLCKNSHLPRYAIRCVNVRVLMEVGFLKQKDICKRCFNRWYRGMR